jgi:hypothetical protein
MLASRLSNRGIVCNVRVIARSCSGSSDKTSEVAATQEFKGLPTATYKPDNLDKRILVHYKYYPNVESVPRFVSESIMTNAKSRARIKLSNIMIVATLLGCLATAIFAKKQAHRISVIEQSQRRHEAWQRGEESGPIGRWSLATDALKKGPEEKEKVKD